MICISESSSSSSVGSPMPTSPSVRAPSKSTHPMHELPPRYSKIRLLRHTNLGAVWLALDTKTNQRVVLKLSNIAEVRKLKSHENPVLEARLLAILNTCYRHPNV